MANHAHVTTRKNAKLKMTPDNIREILDKLNATIFFNCLTIEDTEYWDGKMGWNIEIKGQEVGRSCWLNNDHHFEIRHGGGSDFIWWVDQRIQDEISKVFNGRVKDDGGSGYDQYLKTWDMPDSFPEYVKHRVGHTLRGLSPWTIIRYMCHAYPKTYRKALLAHRRAQK